MGADNMQGSGAAAGLSSDERRDALRVLVSAMIPDGFSADALTPRARAQVRAGIEAAIVLYDDINRSEAA